MSLRIDGRTVEEEKYQAVNNDHDRNDIDEPLPIGHAI
jgi:hypothetical protein